MKYKIHFAMLGVVFVALFALFRPLGSTPTLAAPTFTGDAAADFIGPDVTTVNDRSTPDVGLPFLNPPTTTVGFPTTTVSGFDIRAVYLNYDRATDTMYVGIDCFVICGDADGDGDPNVTGPTLTALSGTDAADFGDGESFGLLIDTDNNYITDTITDTNAANFNVVVGVRDDDNLSAIGVYSYTGSVGDQLANSPWGPKLPYTVTLFAAPSSTAPDLEFSIANFSKLPGFPAGDPLPPFKVHMGMGSLVDDGIGEDFLEVSSIVITPTATVTPTVTVTATVGTPAATETPVLTPTVPITPTATVTPTLTPTSTVPAPTSVPTTGADLSFFAAPADIDSISSTGAADNLPTQAVNSGIGPDRLQIPALDLDIAVAEKGWQLVTQKNGAQISQWDDVRNAAGWHKNSALPGEIGNVVMSGHNNIYGSVFRELNLLKGGETVYIWKNRVRYAYIVDKVSILPEKYASKTQQAINAAYLQQTDDQRLTLITCWPLTSNTHRVFVTAHLDVERTYIR
ncbi:MAG: sortase [Chloroflexi bacterium]|nr:sortase [Chloroflexota bacterium]